MGWYSPHEHLRYFWLSMVQFSAFYW
jgi:hypothetical protein